MSFAAGPLSPIEEVLFKLVRSKGQLAEQIYLLVREHLLEAMPKETATSATEKIALMVGRGKSHFVQM